MAAFRLRSVCVSKPANDSREPACAAGADAEGRYSAALFVQWVPYALAGGSSWEAEEAGYVRHLLGLLDRFAPGEARPACPLPQPLLVLASHPARLSHHPASSLFNAKRVVCSPQFLPSPQCPPLPAGASDLVVDTFTLTPPAIERYFGITRGHIHHIDNSLGFADRFPYRTPVQARAANGSNGPRVPAAPWSQRASCSAQLPPSQPCSKPVKAHPLPSCLRCRASIRAAQAPTLAALWLAVPATTRRRRCSATWACSSGGACLQLQAATRDTAPTDAL